MLTVLACFLACLLACFLANWTQWPQPRAWPRLHFGPLVEGADLLKVEQKGTKCKGETKRQLQRRSSQEEPQRVAF